jgi:hypothetical protein
MKQPTTDIDDLHEAIKDALTAKYPDATVAFYGRPGDRIVTPGILLEMEDIQADDPDDIGTEQLPCVLNFNAYCVLDYKSGQKQAVKTLAGAVLAFVRGKRWGVPVGAASALGAYPDAIRGKEDDYEVMRVEFSHEALLGADTWRLDSEDEEGNPLPSASEVYSSGGLAGETPNPPVQITE